MKSLLTKAALITAVCMGSLTLFAQSTDAPTPLVSNSTSDTTVVKKKFWRHLIPNAARIQYAGNMGMFSVGPVWTYAKHWETAFTIGFVPKHESDRTRATLNLKQDYIPWTVHFGDRWHFQPLATGLYLNAIMGHRFWHHLPSRYPTDKYYWFSTKVRINVYLGERLKVDIPSQWNLPFSTASVFYEISSNEYHIIQRVHNSYLSPSRYLSLSFGFQLAW